MPHVNAPLSNDFSKTNPHPHDAIPAYTATYNPHVIEADTQAKWLKDQVYRVLEDDQKPKFYACSMLPYPSGKLHMGHVRNYTINDMMARYLRKKGFNVLMPMGWDAFGMPAENAAIAHHISPAQWTQQNIADMKAQMQPLGLAIDWQREISTCAPDYYRWNQWLFLKMRECGIAYRKLGIVNWDPVDQTVLANEQVIDGKGWRSGAQVEKREIPMYYLNITRYADELIDDLAPLGWPERVKIMQRNWIGKSTGVRLAFTHSIGAALNPIQAGKLWVFTTRADTLMGVTFCAIAATHPLATHLAANQPHLQAFIQDCQQGGVMEAELANTEKKGIFTGAYVQHPLTGADIPLWIGNYVLMSYGEGAVMGVPAHDERDFAFALQYGLAIQPVIEVKCEKTQTALTFDATTWQDWYASKAGTCIHSDILTGLNFESACSKVIESLTEKGLGHAQNTYRLRDWGISRQRYWGTPIPIIHCPSCGEVPVPEKDLPVVLPTHLMPDGGGNILARTPEFYQTTCPTCGQAARRETDTMDTFVDSSWYFMRYANPDAPTMVDERVNHWLPMDQYIGGIEHAILHLLYARFWTKVMRDMGLVQFGEPFKNLLTQGMVLNDSFYREDASGKKTWYYPQEVDVTLDEKGRITGATLLADGAPVTLGGIEKMSKSKNNVVEPKTLIAQYGVDTARLFTMFAAPPEQSLEWNDHAVEGSYRYLKRVWHFCQQPISQIQVAQLSTLLAASGESIQTHIAKTPLTSADQKLRFDLHTLLKQALYDFERLQYNTVVSACMKLFNVLEDYVKQQQSVQQVHVACLHEGITLLLSMLYPIVPHITSMLWQQLNMVDVYGELLDAPLPQVQADALIQQSIELVLQINGKTKGNITIAPNACDETIQTLAKQSAIAILQKQQKTDSVELNVQIIKVIVVANRLVNVVAKVL